MTLAVALMLASAGCAMADEPSFEIGELKSGLPGSIEIPTLGTWDVKLVYCVYSNDIRSVLVQWTRDAGRTWAKPVQVMGLPGGRYITDANVLVDRDRITVIATHVLDAPDHPGAIAQSEFLAATSEDGGRTWSPPQAIPLARKYVCGCIHAPVWLDGDAVVMGWSWDVPAEEGKPVTD